MKIPIETLDLRIESYSKFCRDIVINEIDKALQVVADLCEGKQKWTMSVPARPDSDPDLIIAAALSNAKLLIIVLSETL